MPRMKPTEAYLTDVRREWEQAETNKERKAVIDEARKPFGYSYSNMTRKLNLCARKRSLSPKQEEHAKELETYVKKVYDFKARAEADAKSFSVEIAYQCLYEDGQIPKEYTLSMIRRVSREKGIANEYHSPARKFKGRASPLELVLLDYSKSDFFHYRDSGKIYMRRHVETKKEEPRLYFAAAIDWTSRVAWFKYYMERGENAKFVRDAMLEAFEEKPDFDMITSEIKGHRRLLQGIPKELYFDRGKGNTAGETATGLLKLMVKKITGSVEIDIKGRRTNKSNSKARGMVEKAIKDFKDRFEARLWGRKLLGDLPPHITLEDLNEWATAYAEEINCSFHPVRTDEIRWNIFKTALSEAAFPPDDAPAFFKGSITRVVQRRLILGNNKQEWFIAPDWVHDGQSIDVVFVGRDCYTFRKNQMVKLQPQKGSVSDQIESESGSELYEDRALKERLANELLHQSGGEITLRTLSKNLKDDVKEFLEKVRSINEVKEKAMYFIMVTRSEQRPLNVIDFQSP